MLLATSLTAATLGCGLISKAKNIAGTAQVLSDFADRLGKAAKLTYTAEYQVNGANSATDKVTLVQQPPNVAIVGQDGGIFITTAEAMFFCDKASGAVSCQKTPNNAAKAAAADPAMVSGVAGPGFITPEIALGLVAAAAFVPGATVDQSNRTIAGQSSLCANATGLEKAASPGDTSAPKDFSVCITEAGILASFSGTSTDGQQAKIELTKYSDKADPSAFAPPAGATVVDVTAIDPSK